MNVSEAAKMREVDERYNLLLFLGSSVSTFRIDQIGGSGLYSVFTA